MNQEKFSPGNKEAQTPPPDQLVRLNADVYNKLQNFEIQIDESELVKDYIQELVVDVEKILVLEGQITASGTSPSGADYHQGSDLKNLLISKLLHCLNTNADGSNRIEATKVKLESWKKTFIVYKYCLDLDPKAKVAVEDLKKELAFEQIIEGALIRLDALPDKQLTSGKPDERILLVRQVESDLEQLSEQRRQHEQSLALSPEQITRCHLILTTLEKDRGIFALNFHSIALADHQITLEQLNYVGTLLTSIMRQGEELLELGYYHDPELTKLQQEVDDGRAKIAELRKKLDD